MKVLNLYVARLFLMRFVLILCTMLALMQLLDFLANAADITQNSEQPVEALLRYGWLRLPDMASQIMPFTVLIAALVTLASLAQDNEIVVMKMAGVSYYQVLRALIPVGLAIGCLHFYIADQLVPKAAPLVRDIDPEFDRSVGQDHNSEVWIKDGKDIVNAESVTSNGRHIVELRIFQRDAEGRLLSQIEAASADYVDGRWTLRSVRRASTESRTIETLPSLVWQTEIRPHAFDWLATLPKELPVERLWRFINNPDLASRPIYYYSTWLYERLSLPVKSMLMLLLAAPAAQILRRRSGLGPALALGFGIGFLFFVMDGVAVTMGEAGKLPPMFAAWISTIVFVSGGTALLLQVER